MTMSTPETAWLIEQLEGTSLHRVLRRLAVEPGPTGLDAELPATFIGIVVDCETTGLDVASDAIIELAVRRFRYNDAGRIVEIGRAYSWREDPRRALGPEIVQLTGLHDIDLVGCEIDTEIATGLLRSASVVVAHNAAFDRKMIERRLPAAAGLAWACSCRELDWPAAGFDGRGLGWLLAQAGWFHGAHRAEGDVDAVIQLLRHTMPDGRTALRELIDTASEPSVLLTAVGTHFDVKDVLKARGYRWDAAGRVWCREVPQHVADDEEHWLLSAAYRPEHRPYASGPSLARVTWRERHA